MDPPRLLAQEGRAALLDMLSMLRLTPAFAAPSSHSGTTTHAHTLPPQHVCRQAEESRKDKKGRKRNLALLSFGDDAEQEEAALAAAGAKAKIRCV